MNPLPAAPFFQHTPPFPYYSPFVNQVAANSMDTINFYDPNQTTTQDTSVITSIASSIAAALVHDRLDREVESGSSILRNKVDLTLIDLASDPKFKLAIESLGMDYNLLTLENVNKDAFFLPTQTVVLSASSKQSCATLSADIISKLSQFVADGGLLISFNHGIRIFPQAFPSTAEPSPKHTLQKLSSRMEFNFVDGLMSAFENDCFCILDGGAPLIKIIDEENVEVLAKSKELEKKMGQSATAIRFKYKEGKVYHLISPLFIKKGPQRKDPKFFTEKLKDKGASEKTIIAWKYAEEMGHGDTFEEADNKIPFLEFLAKIIVRHYLVVEKKMDTEQQQ